MMDHDIIPSYSNKLFSSNDKIISINRQNNCIEIYTSELVLKKEICLKISEMNELMKYNNFYSENAILNICVIDNCIIALKTTGELYTLNPFAKINIRYTDQNLDFYDIYLETIGEYFYYMIYYPCNFINKFNNNEGVIEFTIIDKELNVVRECSEQIYCYNVNDRKHYFIKNDGIIVSGLYYGDAVISKINHRNTEYEIIYFCKSADGYKLVHIDDQNNYYFNKWQLNENKLCFYIYDNESSLINSVSKHLINLYLEPIYYFVNGHVILNELSNIYAQKLIPNSNKACYIHNYDNNNYEIFDGILIVDTYQSLQILFSGKKIILNRTNKIFLSDYLIHNEQYYYFPHKENGISKIKIHNRLYKYYEHDIKKMEYLLLIRILPMDMIKIIIGHYQDLCKIDYYII